MTNSDGNKQKTDDCDLPRRPIETLGEVFEDGSFIEVVHDPADRDALHLLAFDGEIAYVGSRVKHHDRTYVASSIDPVIARELRLPAEVPPPESGRELAENLRPIFRRYSGLSDEAAELMARYILATWVMDALPEAPSLLIIGPDTREIRQLLSLIKNLSRHALLLTCVRANDLSTLPTDLGLTLVIEQPVLKHPLADLLDASRKRAFKVARRGTLWSPHFAKTIHCVHQLQAGGIKAVKLVVAPSAQPLPLLDDRELDRIGRDFQPRLLSFRFANFEIIRSRIIENSVAASASQPTVRAFAEPSGGCADLHAQIVHFVDDDAADVREERLTDLNVVLLESLLVACHIPNQTSTYMGEIAEIMMTMLSARGEERKIQPNQVGKMIRALGLKPEPRDSDGVKLILSKKIRRRIHELAREFAVPSMSRPVPGCPQCEESQKKADRP